MSFEHIHEFSRNQHFYQHDIVISDHIPEENPRRSLPPVGGRFQSPILTFQVSSQSVPDIYRNVKFSQCGSGHSKIYGTKL